MFVAVSVVQVVEHFCSKLEVLKSTPSTAKILFAFVRNTVSNFIQRKEMSASFK
jgi:hypothetical protein